MLRSNAQILSRAAVRVLLALLCCTSSQVLLAQSPSIDFSAERNYVFENSSNGLLPFVAVINNPSASALADVSLVFTMPAALQIGNVDRICTETADSSTRTLQCSVPVVTAHSSKILDFYIDGPNSRAVGASFTVSLASASLPVNEPDAFTASLADGDRHIRGANLTVHLVRDIELDIDRNGVPDLDEAIMGLPTGTPVDQLLARPAVIDILFLSTPAAQSYLGNKLPSRISQMVTATNQVFRENQVGIKFNGVGLASVPYTATSTTLANTLDLMLAGSDPAFSDLGEFVRSSGGDLVVLLHALDPGTDSYCGYAAQGANGRQGDFRPEYHQGKLISVVNVGPDCLGLGDLSPLLAANMGIVATRQEAPDGGTFSYSAGYGVTDAFATLAARLGRLPFGQATLLNRFSSPATLCLSLPCGVDRNDLAQGADAVYSLNKTRHLVSAITPTVFPADPTAIPDRRTVSTSLNYDLEILQTPVDTAALYNEFTQIQVHITNVSGETLENLNVALVHLNNGLVSPETQNYEIDHPACRILGDTLTTAGINTGTAEQKTGTLTCFIESLAPTEQLDFSYRIQIDTTPPMLNGEGYYHEMVAVNGIAQPESALCLPVFANFVLANVGSAVCDSVQILIPGLAPGIPLDLNALPSVTGDRLSLPFLRLWDGDLISAEIRITLDGPVELEIESYTDLDDTLTPVYEANYDLAGTLHINNLQVDTAFYDVQATYVIDSSPIRFSNLTTVLISQQPTP